MTILHYSLFMVLLHQVLSCIIFYYHSSVRVYSLFHKREMAHSLLDKRCESDSPIATNLMSLLTDI